MAFARSDASCKGTSLLISCGLWATAYENHAPATYWSRKMCSFKDLTVGRSLPSLALLGLLSTLSNGVSSGSIGTVFLPCSFWAYFRGAPLLRGVIRGHFLLTGLCSNDLGYSTRVVTKSALD